MTRRSKRSESKDPPTTAARGALTAPRSSSPPLPPPPRCRRRQRCTPYPPRRRGQPTPTSPSPVPPPLAPGHASPPIQPRTPSPPLCRCFPARFSCTPLTLSLSFSLTYTRASTHTHILSRLVSSPAPNQVSFPVWPLAQPNVRVYAPLPAALTYPHRGHAPARRISLSTRRPIPPTPPSHSLPRFTKERLFSSVSRDFFFVSFRLFFLSLRPLSLSLSLLLFPYLESSHAAFHLVRFNPLDTTRTAARVSFVFSLFIPSCLVSPVDSELVVERALGHLLAGLTRRRPRSFAYFVSRFSFLYTVAR